MRNLINRCVFQPPPATYSRESYRGELLQIDAAEKTESKIQNFVFLNLPYKQSSSYVLIYFHANAEDIGNIYKFMRMIRDGLKIHVVAVEYPGYGIAEGQPSAESLNDCARQVYKYVRSLQWPSNRIIICGRSIGTGPATKLAAENPVGALILVSPFTSIEEVAKHLLGMLGAMLASSYWENLDSIKNVNCPILFVHGKDDRIIPHEHSLQLYENCTHNTHVRAIQVLNGFGHNDLSWWSLIGYFRDFLTANVFIHSKANVDKPIKNEGWFSGLSNLFFCMRDESTDS